MALMTQEITTKPSTWGALMDYRATLPRNERGFLPSASKIIDALLASHPELAEHIARRRPAPQERGA